MITHLKHNEVFVFGSNLQGFHGAGSAGYAMRGTTANTWRTDKAFIDIKSGKNPNKRGKWAVFGVGEGFQEGIEGCSYAIPTVERPGKQGCVTLRSFTYSAVRFIQFAHINQKLSFRVVKLGATRAEGGYSWLGMNEVNRVWNGIRSRIGIPSNVIFE